MALESVGGQCLFTSEWDKYARQTYEANFEVNHKIYGDVREIDEKLIPKHDVLVAGFPCQRKMVTYGLNIFILVIFF